MARYIDAEELTEEIESLSVMLGGENVFKTAKKSVLRIIDEQPTADVEEVKHGEWIEIIKDIGRGRTLIKYQCNKCDVYTAKELNYCPNCGADMRGVKDE
jgi:rubrerythrin